VNIVKPKIDHLVFAFRDMEDFAHNLQKGTESWLHVGQIEWKAFEDGCPNIFIHGVEDLRGRHCVFLADFFSPINIFQQLSVLYALPRYCCASLTILLPYYPTGTMERVDNEGQIATASTMAKMLSGIPPTAEGPAKLVIYDIHALQERFFFGEGVVPVLDTAIPALITHLKAQFTDELPVICFPDDGAHKRFYTFFKGFTVVICSKVRDGDLRIVKIKEGAEACQGKSVVLVDDLVRTGGTLIECKKAIVAAGASKTMCFVTHAVFPEKSYEKFFQNESGSNQNTFDHFYVTDSCPTITKELVGKKPFEILSIVPCFQKLLASGRVHP